MVTFQRHRAGRAPSDRVGDITNAPAVRSAAVDCDALVHLAALVAPRPRWSAAYQTNVVGTANVLEAAAGRPLVHVSSPSVAFGGHPATGEVALPARYQGHDRYTRSKAIAERWVLDHATGPVVVLRPHLVWGPGDTQLIGRIIERADQGRLVLPDRGRALIDTTYVDDAASAVVAGLDRCFDQPAAWGRPLVVSGGDPRTLAELVERILSAYGRTIEPRTIPAPVLGVLGATFERLWLRGEPPLTHFAARQLSVAHWFDQRQTRDLLGWAPRVGIEEGFARLARYASSNEPR